MPSLRLVTHSTGDAAGRGPALFLAFLPPAIACTVILGVGPASLGLLGLFYLTVLLAAGRSGELSTRALVLLGLLVLTVLVPVLAHGFLRGDIYPAIWVHVPAVLLAAALGWRYYERAPWRASFYVTALLIGLLVVVRGPALEYGEVNATYVTLPLLALWLPVAVRDATMRGVVSILPILTVAGVGLITFSRSVTFSAAGALALVVAYGFVVGDLRNRWTVAGLLVVAAGMAVVAVTAPVPADAQIVVQTVGQGLESPRFAFWADYLASFDVLDWILGPKSGVVDRFVRRAFTGVGNTLHNSVLQTHSYGGLLPALAVVVGWVAVYLRMVRITRVPVHPALLVLAAKGSFDVIAFPQRFDIVYAVVLFALFVRGVRSTPDGGRARIVFSGLGRDRSGAAGSREPRVLVQLS